MRDLITKIELAMFESALNPTDPADDYAAKKKALYDLETNPNVMQEPELMKAVAQRKADLEKEIRIKKSLAALKEKLAELKTINKK
jgi:hypothetical protein